MRITLCLLVLVSGCLKRYSDWDAVDSTPASSTAAAGAPVLSAFFGLDNGLTPRVERLCPGAAGMDGMPLIFSHEVDIQTLQAGDVVVITAAGKRMPVHCLTMGPALDAGELRTALLAGEFGGADDPPASVQVTGHVLSLDGRHDFFGATIPVTPLADGPFLVLAEAATAAQYGGKRTPGPAHGTRCPTGTAQAIRVTWAGGISRPTGGDVDMQEGARYALRLTTGELVAPDALADLHDNDNNHLLCLTQANEVASVSFPAGLVVDPNKDLNPAVEVPVRAP